MRKIILDLAVTLDGFIEGPNGELDWLDDDPEVDFGDILNGILEGVDTIFYGRVSYDMWGNYQPDENASDKLKAAYRVLHSKKKYVFSRTQTAGTGDATYLQADSKEAILELLRQPGENIWLYGGAELVTTFVNMNLVDVYRLAVHPVILGAGKPLFSDIRQRINLKLTDVKRSDTGLLMLTYAADRS